MVQTIILATDGSTCAQRAADYVAVLARRVPVQVVVVHAYLTTPRKTKASFDEHPDFETEEQAQQLVNRVIRQLRDLGIEDILSEVWEGPAANVILGAADTYHPEFLVVGARGQSLWPGTCLGSVSMAVAQRAECPVLIVR